MSVIIGFLIIFVSFILAMASQPVPLIVWFNLPSLYIISIPIIAIIIVSGLKEFLDGWKFIINKNIKPSNNELRASAKVFDLLFKTSIGSGLIGTLIGFISMLCNLGGDLYLIGIGLSTALLSNIYGLILGIFIFLPIKTVLLKMIDKKTSV